MTRLILVRHGETEWNRVERFRGRIDIELNETGHRQAQAVASRVGAWKPDAIYSSPLKRALQTAQPLAQACGREIKPLETITDIDYGAWGGHSPEEVAAQHSDLYRTWLEAPHLVQFPEGESLEQVRSRAWIAVEEVCAAHARETVVLVSHVVVNRALICAVLGLDNSSLWKIGQDNGAISIVDAKEDEYRLVLLNDTCHLEALSETGT